MVNECSPNPSPFGNPAVYAPPLRWIELTQSWAQSANVSSVYGKGSAYCRITVHFINKNENGRSPVLQSQEQSDNGQS